jgi:hypothetical protein
MKLHDWVIVFAFAVFVLVFSAEMYLRSIPVVVTGGNEFFGEHNVRFLTINNERWEVYQDSTMEDWGDTYCDARVISIKITSNMTEGLKRSTMWHEIEHAYECNLGKLPEDRANWVHDLQTVGQDTKEHRTIESTSVFLANFVHDNPEFMKWAEDWK